MYVWNVCTSENSASFVSGLRSFLFVKEQLRIFQTNICFRHDVPRNRLVFTHKKTQVSKDKCYQDTARRRRAINFRELNSVLARSKFLFFRSRLKKPWDNSLFKREKKFVTLPIARFMIYFPIVNHSGRRIIIFRKNLNQKPRNSLSIRCGI